MDDDIDSNKDCGRANKCFEEFRSKFELLKNCAAYCPHECKSEIFNINEEGIMSNFSGNYDQRKLNLYFPELKYIEIDQIHKVTVSNMISNIGGTLGLFLGLSLLSFMEFIEFLVFSFQT